MSLRRLLLQLLHNDARLILRDRMLVMLLTMVLVVGLVAPFALAEIDTTLAANGVMPSATSSLRFSSTFPMFVTFIALWQAALMPGTVFGFILLEEKEDDTLTALRTTPVPMQVYLGYRLAIPGVLAFGFTMALVPLIGISAIGAVQLVPIALGAALVAPLTMLLLAGFADNKVQGLAFTKFTGIAGLTILIGWFVPEPYQWFLGVFPPFLVSKAYWLLLEGRTSAWIVLALGIAGQVALGWLLVGRFRRTTLER